MTELTSRRPTPVDAIAEEHFDASIALSPLEATYAGIPGHEHRIDDFSPEGYTAKAAISRQTLAKLDAATANDDVDAVTIAAMRERLGLHVELHESGYEFSDLNVIASPLQNVRDVFDLMDTSSDDDWANIGARMKAVPQALAGWRESLLRGATEGHVAAVRQINACIKQCEDFTAPDGFFAEFAKSVPPNNKVLASEVREAITVGAAGYAEMGDWLRTELLPKAPTTDGVGREAYQLFSRKFLGATVDLDETYAWGNEEVARISAQMSEVAERITPGVGAKGAMKHLDADERYGLYGTDALQVWMQGKANEAVESLADTHFDIPEPVRRIECMIAPTHSGGIYYTGPSEDFSRPGRMWWSVPKGVERFSTWRELTTVYHEGVPGHHLQVGQTMYRSSLLNRWRRMGAWTSGHGEGWALYSELLMAELGFLDDDAYRLGMLDAQSFRASRVVLDIGIHCGLPAPAEVGGGQWTYDKAWTYLNAHSDMSEGVMRFELDRYLGWPGQAPGYKIGERLWLQLRDDVKKAKGADFDLKQFHREALDIGSVGLDVLRDAVLGRL